MIDDYIEEINRRLVVSTRQRMRIVEDIREHLADAVEQLASKGADDRTAQANAIRAFGSAADIATQFNGHAAAVAMRRTPLVMAACGMAVVGGFLLAAITQPSPVVARSAGIVQQVAFFAAVLGLELAVVAGLRVAARAAARYRTTPSSSDQLLIRRAADVFVAGLAVAAGGWTIVIAEVLAGSANRRTAPLAVGLIVMLSATIVAGIAIARQRPQGTSGEPAPEPGGDRSAFGVAERWIQSVGNRPRTTGAVAAIVAGLAAMSHAETTLTGALPWGVIQAAAVVAGFVLLGPALELRSPAPVRRHAD